jgi:hypothetical protein
VRKGIQAKGDTDKAFFLQRREAWLHRLYGVLMTFERIEIRLN